MRFVNNIDFFCCGKDLVNENVKWVSGVLRWKERSGKGLADEAEPFFLARGKDEAKEFGVGGCARSNKE